MLRLLIASSLLSFSVHAAHLDTVCKSAIERAPIFGDGLTARMTHDYRHILENFDGDEIYEHNQRILSVVNQGEKVWLLTYSEILEMNKDGSMLKRYPLSMSRTMTLAGDQLIVVRSGGTISAIDTKSGAVNWTIYMNEIKGGEAVAVAFDGINAHLAMSTTYENGYTGIVTIDPKNGNVLKTIPYDVRKAGVIAPDAKMKWHNDSLVLNNSGWIHVVTAKQLAAAKPFKPRWVAHVMSQNSDPHYMMLKGDFFFEGNELVACGSFRERTESSWDMKSGLFHIQMK